MRSEKFIAFSCPHAPLHDPDAVAWAVDRIAKYKPDHVVCLGDGIEANSASQWPDARELAIDLKEEYDALDNILADIRKAAPNARRRYLAGNHETNVMRAGRLDPRIRSICDWRSLKNVPELEHWQVHGEYNYSRHRGCVWLGQVAFSHGYECSESQIRTEALYFLKNQPYSLYCHGHTHRPTPVTEIKINSLGMDRFYVNPGCLRNLEPDYMTRKRKWAWGNGLIQGEAVPVKSPRQCREWSAELLTLRMYDGAAA
jgi:predicted phosphodiesterase